MPTADPRYFERDPNAAARLAAQFGAGGGTAEQLIEANSLRYGQELTAAVGIARDDEATAELTREDVASAAGVEDPFNILDFAARGRYVTYVALDPSGRSYKGVLLNQGGELEAPEGGNASPQQAVLQARVQGASQLQAAKQEAERILEEAKAQAQQMLADAAAQNVEREQQVVASTQEDPDADDAGTPTEESDHRTPEGPKQQRQKPGQAAAGKPGDQKRGGRSGGESAAPGDDPSDSPEGIGNK